MQVDARKVHAITCAGVIRLSAIKVEAPGSLRRKRALPDTSDDESIPEDWTGFNFTPSWQVAVERQEALTVTDKHESTPTISPPWSYPESIRDRQYYTVFKDLHDKGYGICCRYAIGTHQVGLWSSNTLQHSV